MKVGTLCYSCEQGLGYLAKSFYDNKIITDMMILEHSHRSRPTKDWYPKGTPMVTTKELKRSPAKVQEFLKGLDVAIFFETPFHWPLLNYCKQVGTKTVIVPMYEWFPRDNKFPIDKIFAPSLLDQDYFPGSVFLPIPVETKYWRQRTVANTFLHNSGNIGCREHKGTRQLVEAARYIRSDAKLTIRSQDSNSLRSIVNHTYQDELPYCLKVEYGVIDYDTLWDNYDVLVAPEKFNGLSLPLQEARAAGMVVMTTDRYPMNTWLPTEPLIPVHSTATVRVSRGHLEFEESKVTPEAIADWYGKDITQYSIDGKQWANDNSWQSLTPRYMDELEKVCQL
jgi:hypothetical protein